MKAKSTLKSFLLALLFTVILAVNVNSTKADSVNGNEEKVVTQNSTSGNRAKVQNTTDLKQQLLDNGALETKNGVTTFTISDDALQRILVKESGTKGLVQFRAKRKVSGVTRVKNYGNGNFDIYLSKNMLNFIRGKGFKYGFTIVVNLIATAAGIPSMGVATAVITSAASTLVSLMINQVNPFKVGRVFKIRKWKYAGWRYQYA